MSIQLAINEGIYETFPGSPTSEGKLQFDLWREEFNILGPNALRKKEDDDPLEPAVWGQHSFALFKDGIEIDYIRPTWEDLKRCVVEYGMRNSLLTALMPTATTAQIRRNCESVEAHQNNMYSRKVLTCSYPVMNRFLVEDLEKVNAWNSHTSDYITMKNGSVLGLTKYVQERKDHYPLVSDFARLKHIEAKYKTIWEIPQKLFMRLSADRGRYIDQSSSNNVYIADCTVEKLRACHLYANMLGLKTIMYYLRQTGAETIKFTADSDMLSEIKGLKIEEVKEVKEVKEDKEDKGGKGDKERKEEIKFGERRKERRKEGSRRREKGEESCLHR